MGFKILIVDDDPIIREVLNINLRLKGFTVSSVSSGNDALEQVPIFRPDIVILDVMMPDMDGWEVLKIIKDYYESSSIKILMLTAKSSDTDLMIGKDILKADDYLTKPFDLNELFERLELLIKDLHE